MKNSELKGFIMDAPGNNNVLISGIVEKIEAEEISISSLKKWFPKNPIKRLSADSIVIELTSGPVKRILVIHEINNESVIYSLLFETQSNKLSIEELELKFGKYDIREISTWEISYQLEFKFLSPKKLKSIVLHSLPMQKSDDIPEMIKRTDSWLKSIEFKINLI